MSCCDRADSGCGGRSAQRSGSGDRPTSTTDGVSRVDESVAPGAVGRVGAAPARAQAGAAQRDLRRAMLMERGSVRRRAALLRLPDNGRREPRGRVGSWVHPHSHEAFQDMYKLLVAQSPEHTEESGRDRRENRAAGDAHTHTHTHTHTETHTLLYLSLSHTQRHACVRVCVRERHSPTHTLSHTKRLKSNYIHTYVHTYIHTYMQTDRQTQQGVTGAAPLCHLPSIVTEVSHIGHHMSKSVKQSYSNRGVSYRASHEQEREAVIRRRRPPLTSFPHRKR